MIGSDLKLSNHEQSIKKTFTIPYVSTISESFYRLRRNLVLTWLILFLTSWKNLLNSIKIKLITCHFVTLFTKLLVKIVMLPTLGRLRDSWEQELRNMFRTLIRSDSSSIISNHRLELNHKINWNETRNMDSEPSCNKRLVLEMIYIKK